MTKLRLPTVRSLLIVASGKGGVGKTTVTVNLALALQARGARVGIFDADIYGPNVPLALGIHRREAGNAFVPILRQSDALPYIDPLERYGLQIMSTGLLVSEAQVINPLADTVGQLAVRTLRDVKWGQLDYLLLDLPPSAGQPQQSLLQFIHFEGAIVVTTPQDLSLLDASRSWQLFADNQVPILGLVENMSYFVCPSCGEQHAIFPGNGRPRPHALADARLLCAIPLSPTIAQRVDRGHPLLNGEPAGPAATAFLQLADTILQPA
jgi:ATP-binding protein involved in chromosome partitioning